MRKKQNKKAQIAGQIFIYILAIFVFAVIILYGYSAIKGFISKGQETAFIQFKNTLEGEVSRIYTEPGDIIVFNERNPLIIPGDYKTVCFVSSNADENSIIPDNINPELKTILTSAVESGLHNTTENVFLYPPAKNPIYLGYIETSPEILCINPSQSRLDIRIEGLGYGTRINNTQ